VSFALLSHQSYKDQASFTFLGLNGVDNGILSFDHVRIPRENLLSKWVLLHCSCCNLLAINCFPPPCRYANVTADGEYVTSIESDGARFNVTLAALVGTRVALCFQAIGPAKVDRALHACHASRSHYLTKTHFMLL
jgi:hypothetical protein